MYLAHYSKMTTNHKRHKYIRKYINSNGNWTYVYNVRANTSIAGTNSDGSSWYQSKYTDTEIHDTKGQDNTTFIRGGGSVKDIYGNRRTDYDVYVDLKDNTRTAKQLRAQAANSERRKTEVDGIIFKSFKDEEIGDLRVNSSAYINRAKNYLKNLFK